MQYHIMLTASWSSGRVQDSESGSRSSPGSNILPVHLLVPLSKALHTALLHSTQAQMGTCKGRFVSLAAKLRVSGCIPPRDLRWISRWIYADWKGPMTKEGTCQRLQSRALSLDVNSKQCIYFMFQYISSKFTLNAIIIDTLFVSTNIIYEGCYRSCFSGWFEYHW